MTITHDSIRSLIDSILPDLVVFRHTLHQRPELAGQEYETRELLKAMIAPHDPLFWQPKLGTDLVFEIPGRDPGRVIGFRADMDALPLDETDRRLPYASQHPAVMHACGHDGHMAVLMGTALVLSKIRDKLPCTVRMIFQPGEEEACLGAKLVEKGVCDGLETVYGFHNWPGLPVGTVSSRPGILFAAANTFRTTVTGVGAHGAAPEKGNNPIIAAAKAVLQIQDLHDSLQRENSGVVSVCAVQGGSNTNVIPSEVSISGTVRYIDAQVGERIEAAIREVFQRTSEESGVSVSMDYDRSYHLPVINSIAEVERLRYVTESCLGDSAYIEAESYTMTAEDFAFYLDRVPGCMFWLGSGVDSPQLHTQSFDFNDEAMAPGIHVLTALALGDSLV